MAKKEEGEKKPSQKKMVQAALDHYGFDAKPGDMGAFIKEQFDVELAPNIISNYKSQIKREGQSTSSGTGRTRKVGNMEVVNDLKVLRGLVARLGAAQVKELVDVVG